MCGRARCTLRPDDVPRASHRHGVRTRFLHLDRYRPSYNVAPGSYMPVLRTDNDGVAVHCMKWGLVPGFTKNTDKPDFFKMFNARSESVAEKASFRRLLPKNRCLVAVDGFYEWKKEGSKKQPYYIHFKDGRPLVFAALFDSWQNSGGETLYTFTILTTSSSSAFQWLHDRMPVILGAKESVDTWLDDPSMSKLKPLLTPYENSDLVWYPVTSAIGKLSFDGPECIQQLPLKASQNSLISKFFLAKQPKTDEGDKETKSTDSNISVDLKEEPLVESYKGAVFSDSNKKAEELDEEKDKEDEAEEDTSEEDRSIKTGLTKVTDESNASIPAESENQLDEPSNQLDEPSNQLELQHEAVQDKQGSERNEKTVLDCQTMKEGGLEFSETFSGKSGTKKRDYELFSAQEKPWNQSERLQDVKSCGKHGKGKSNIKKSKDTQSTLHFFFDEK